MRQLALVFFSVSYFIIYEVPSGVINGSKQKPLIKHINIHFQVKLKSYIFLKLHAYVHDVVIDFLTSV